MNGDILVTYIDDQLFVDANDAIAQVRALQQENATLVSLFEVASRRHREVVDRLVLDNEALQDDVMKHALNNGMLMKCVTDRNDALKELVQDFASFAKHVMNQWGIELEAGYATDAPPAEWKQCLYELDMLAERMRKLGIEV